MFVTLHFNYIHEWFTECANNSTHKSFHFFIVVFKTCRIFNLFFQKSANHFKTECYFCTLIYTKHNNCFKILNERPPNKYIVCTLIIFFIYKFQPIKSKTRYKFNQTEKECSAIIQFLFK